MLELSVASEADELFLLNLRKATMTDHLRRVGLACDDEAHYLRIRADFRDARLIWHQGVLVGMLKLSRRQTPWFLHQIQILPGFQNRGIGAGILRTVLADAERAGASVCLSVLNGNPARQLYERLGFRRIAQTQASATMKWFPSRFSSPGSCAWPDGSDPTP